MKGQAHSGDYEMMVHTNTIFKAVTSAKAEDVRVGFPDVLATEGVPSVSSAATPIAAIGTSSTSNSARKMQVLHFVV